MVPHLITALTGPINGSKDDEYRRRTAEQMNQSFRGLQEMVTNAKLTAVSVLADPARGLGPGAQRGQGSLSRQQLAMAGGLSPRNLRLL